jgi:GT2 family glycosyltransferase
MRAAEAISCEVFVVDNNSVDGSLAMVAQKFPTVKLIANKQNVGFSRANNQAIRMATGRYVLLLNPDTLVEEDTFAKVVAFMDAHPDAGGLGVKMIDGKGQFLPESKRGLPTPAVAFYKIFGLAALFPKSRTFGKYHLGYLDNDETHEVEILSGAFMLMRKETLDKVGLLDEAFFMYGEDIDLSYRIVQGGYKNYYFPDTRIIHYKGESTKKSSVNYVFVFYRAMVIFAEKHFSARNAKAFSFFINLAIYLRAGIALLSRFVRKAALPVIDAAAVLVSLYLLKEFYESYTSRTYQLEFVNLALGLYTAIWMVSIYLGGGYDKPVKPLKILRGIAVGTIAILTLYALLPESLRFSRALILLGTASTAAVYLGIRYMLNLLGVKGFRFGATPDLQIGIVANSEEFMRIKNLLADTGTPLKSVMRIAPESTPDSNRPSAERLGEIVDVYKLDTLIFSGQDVPSHRIIGLMAEVETTQVDFKIAPPESLYIIGSNSVEKGGELFIMDLNAVSKSANRRKKRLFDLGISVLLLLGFPLLIWWVDKKGGYFGNIFSVMAGAKSWVGYAPSDVNRKKLPQLRRGVLNPLDRIGLLKAPEETARKLNAIYARDYSVRNDLHILSAGFKNLGRVD